MKRLIVGLLSFALSFSAGAQYWRDGPQTVGQGTGLWYPGVNFPFTPWNSAAVSTSLTMDAVGEKVSSCGYLMINDGSASKTITGADPQASIGFGTGAVTFADSATTPTTIRVSVQDFDTSNGPPGRPDETADVYSDIVVGDSEMNSSSDNTWVTTLMETGSQKTMNAGSLYCIVWDMTARGSGATDTVTLSTISTLGGRTSVTALKTGGTWAAAVQSSNAIITFDDGSIGWIDGAMIYSSLSGYTFNTGTSFDEYGLVCQVPFDAVISAVAYSSAVAATSAHTVKIYSDPFGTPTLIDSLVVDPHNASSTTTGTHQVSGDLSAPVRANTPFAVTLLATSANNVTLTYFNVSSATHLAAWPGGTSCYGIYRDGSSGAFTPATTTLPILFFRLKKISVH